MRLFARGLRAAATVIGAWTAGLVTSAGCAGDECPTGAARCEGSVATTCVSRSDTEISGHNVWVRQDCGARWCVVANLAAGGAEALCALATAPDSRCAAAAE